MSWDLHIRTASGPVMQTQCPPHNRVFGFRSTDHARSPDHPIFHRASPSERGRNTLPFVRLYGQAKTWIQAANRDGVREVFDYRYFPYSGRIAWTGPLASHSP